MSSLSGRKEITQYARRSWETVMDWVKKDNFPVVKIDGVWESDTALIDEWKRKKIIGQYTKM